MLRMTSWGRWLPLAFVGSMACATNTLPLSDMGGDTTTDGETTTDSTTGQGGASGTTTSSGTTTTTTTTTSTGAGGGATTTTSSSSSSTTTTSSSSSSTSTSTTTKPPSCKGVYDSGIPACNTCLESGCCQELVDCNNDPDCAPCFTGDPACTQSGAAFDAIVACISSSCDVECTPPQAPSCNPVTGDTCDLANGEACDLGSDANGNTSFTCFGAPNDAKLCAACDNQNGPYCEQGYHCDTTNQCAKFCCTDADCGAGAVCDFVFQPDFAVGLCHDQVGGTPACGAPKASPSGGSCM